MSTVSPDSVAQDQILAFYERWERLEAEKSAIGVDLKELFAEAKGNGFSPKALRESFRRVRNIHDASQQEHDAIVDLYVAALTGARPARAREDHSPDARKMVEIIPGNGAGGTEEEASVATYGAASSAQPISGSLRADIPEQTVQPDVAVVSSVVVPESVESSTGVEGDSKPSTHQSIAIATTEPPPSAGANDDRGGEDPPPPASTTVVTLQLRTHNPDTHFLNSHGLERLHGCQNPEVCGSGQPRVRLCFRCSVQHDGPTHGEVA